MIQDSPSVLGAIKLFWWISTAFQLTGVFLLAAHLVAYPPVLCYVIMLVGSMAGLMASLLSKNLALFVLNSGYTLANIIGMARWG